ncbi:hypothetical protein NRIC_35550 [Enterococcus florum]|uniref:HTH LytTR-type domain-containing protein n=1 Tax=Enterococcus florum TaxID=2480627 RepID=A0A4P5PFW0_9ENTE|nr:LytTR family DNA-binding domain-containing protein [Enterococcus florum]GCF95664.1 hypothetical protein NRIC_35550 [Enterococcus florum]
MSIIINTQQRQIQISSEELLYIKTIPNKTHKLCFITIDNEYLCRGDLCQFESAYTYLYRCHRSLLVNLKAIKEINKGKKQIIFKESSMKSCFFQDDV